MIFEELFSVRGKTALVTGAGAGIGRAISLLLAEAGANVACTDLRPEDAERVAEQCRNFAVQSFGAKLDVTNEEERVAIVERTGSELGGLDFLVNNAGGGGPKPFEMPLDDFQWAFQLNVNSIFRLSQLAVPHRKGSGGGAIVNISSMAGQNKNKRMGAYGASKAAVDHLTRNMAFDVGPDNIRVNANGLVKEIEARLGIVRSKWPYLSGHYSIQCCRSSNALQHLIVPSWESMAPGFNS